MSPSFICSLLLPLSLSLSSSVLLTHSLPHSLSASFSSSASHPFRTQLCLAIVTASKAQDRSTSLLSTLLASLVSSFSSIEVDSLRGKNACSKALKITGTLAEEGYLDGSQRSYQMLADAVSAFTTQPVEATRRRLATSADYPVDRIVSNDSTNKVDLVIPTSPQLTILYTLQLGSLVTGIQRGMAEGESPATIVTKNLHLTVTSALISDIGNSLITAPTSAAQRASNAILPKITFGPAGLSACSFAGSYVHLSFAEWVVNPYRNSESIKSSLARFSSLSQDTAPAGASGGVKPSSPVTGQPAYTISMQFHEIQNFNFSAAAAFNSEGKRTQNFTLPACTLYDGSQYVPCQGCKISSYTNYNVTYSCYDITQLCPPVRAKRYLEESGEELEEHDEEEEYGVEQKEEEVSEEDETGHDRSLASERYRSRSLQANDDEVTGTGPTSSKTFGVLIQTVGNQIKVVLSNNPFATDLVQSTVVFALVGCLVSGIALMLICLRRMDYREGMRNTYIKRERNAAARKMLEDDIRKGGSGDLDNLYRKHVRQCKAKNIAPRSLLSVARRVPLSLKYFTPKKHAFSPASAISTKDGSRYGDLDDDGNSMHTESNDGRDDEMEVSHLYRDSGEKQNAMTAVVTEFLHKIFPGRSIFDKAMSAPKMILLNHIYFKMFAGSSLKVSRSIRLLQLMIQVFACFFLDTLFFGIFYPKQSECDSFDDKVSFRTAIFVTDAQ